MKTFIKVFVIFFLSAYTFASFCAWDFSDIMHWSAEGRGIFLFFILAFSTIISATLDSNKK